MNYVWDILLFLLGALLSQLYYLKEAKEQRHVFHNQKLTLEHEIKSLTTELAKYDQDSKLILQQERMTEALEEYKRTGAYKNIIDTYTDLNQTEKADLYDIISMKAKGKKPSNNPYRN